MHTQQSIIGFNKTVAINLTFQRLKMVQYFIELFVGEILEEKWKLRKQFLLNFQIVFRTYVFSELFVVDERIFSDFFFFFFF